MRPCLLGTRDLALRERGPTLHTVHSNHKLSIKKTSLPSKNQKLDNSDDKAIQPGLTVVMTANH